MKSRILVCGGRDYENLEQFQRAMWYARQWFAPAFCIIQGGARGADRKAKDWGVMHGVPVIAMDANWTFYDKKAGTLRNTWMLDWAQPDLVIAFPGGTGTKNMVDQARKRGVDVWEVSRAF